MMAELASPILNWPQLAGQERSCTLVVQNVGEAASTQTTFRFVDSAQIRFTALQTCSSIDIVSCPAVSGGSGSLPDIPPGGQFVLNALLDTVGAYNGVASSAFEVFASNERSRQPLNVRIDADLRSADLRWGAVTLATDVSGTDPLVVEAELQNLGQGNLMVSTPRIESPSGATVQEVSFTTPDGAQVVSSYLGRYPNWDGLPSGGSVRVQLTVQLPAGLSGPQLLRLRTPESADPVAGNDLFEQAFNVH